MISQRRLKELLTYDPANGEFRWRATNSNRAQAGSRAGSVNPDGYLTIRLDAVLYKAHRLAHLYMTGEWPSAHTDHANGARADNRWANLRNASRSENNRNSKTRSHNACGIKGIRQLRSGRWNARIRFDKTEITIGTFDTPDEAYAAYAQQAKRLFGEYATLR